MAHHQGTILGEVVYRQAMAAGRFEQYRFTLATDNPQCSAVAAMLWSPETLQRLTSTGSTCFVCPGLPTVPTGRPKLPPVVEHEGGAAFDKKPILGIEVCAQRRMGSTTGDLPANTVKGYLQVCGHRFERVPIGDDLQIAE